MRFRRTCSGKCPLSDRTRVWGEGPESASLALLGEAPGADEDREGHPFVGKAGRFLNWGLFKAGINRGGCYVLNVINCRPPNNRFNSPEGETAQHCCRKGFEEELEELRRRGLKVIIALGVNAMNALGIRGSIKKIRGSVYEWNGFFVLPTYHPAYFQHMKYTRNDVGVDLKLAWVADLRKAKQIAQEGYNPPKEDFNVRPNLNDVATFIHDALHSERLVAVDIETAPLPGSTSYDSHLVVVGLALDDSRAISVPFLSKGGKPYWSNGDLSKVRGLLNELFERKKKLIFQNALFDVPKLQDYGFEIDFSSVAHDTMLLHHAISPELPHDLGFIVSLYGMTPYWKAEVLERIGQLLEEDDSKVRTYNLRDCVVLPQILPGLLEDLEESGASEIYYKESLPLLGPVGEMIRNGIKIDINELRKYKKELQDRLMGIDKKLWEIGGLPQKIVRHDTSKVLEADVFNLDSPEDLRWFLFGIRPSKLKRLQDLEAYDDPERKRPLKKDTKKYTELLALQQLSEITPIVELKGFRGRRTDNGAVSTNEQGLLSLQLFVQNHIASLKTPAKKQTYEVLLKWLSFFYKHRKTAKLLSTYTSYPVKNDGRVHTQLLIHGTVTGRIASRAPNLMNIPKKEVEARRVFVPKDGHTFLTADYTNIEVWILAYESQDELLLQQLKDGINIHDENTKILFNIGPEDALWSIGRRAAKIFQFGGIQYGGGDREIYEKVILEAPELSLTFSEFVEAHRRWTQAHPGYADWKRMLQRNVLNPQHASYRKAITATGRVRTLMGTERDILKEVLNTPIQGGAASIINRAMIRLYHRLKPLKSRMILQIHDELLLEVWRPELAEVKKTVREEMERPVNWHGEMVSFKTEQKTGSSWKDCYVED